MIIMFPSTHTCAGLSAVIKMQRVPQKREPTCIITVDGKDIQKLGQPFIPNNHQAPRAFEVA